MEPRLLKRLLHARARSLRCNRLVFRSLDEPQSAETDTILTGEGERLRRRIVLAAHGCQRAACTMCPWPDECVPIDTPVSLESIMNQLRSALGVDEEIHTLTLFHNGNFFSDREMSAEFRTEIFTYLRTTRIQELVVESLPSTLTQKRLEAARSELGEIRLVVAMGLQSSSKTVRELCVNAPGRIREFENAVGLLRRQGDEARVFLLFHPPFLTIAESIFDLRKSIEYVHGFGVHPTVCPLHVAPHTVVYDLAMRGLYTPAHPLYLYDALRGLSNVRVAASILSESEDSAVNGAFGTLNGTGRLPHIDRPTMPPVIEPSPFDETIVRERIGRYLSCVGERQLKGSV